MILRQLMTLMYSDTNSEKNIFLCFQLFFVFLKYVRF